jgi:hypothetical protein
MKTAGMAAGLNFDSQRVRGTRSSANAPVSSRGRRSHEGPRKPSGSTSFLSTEMAAITAREPMTTAMPTSRA